MTKPLYEQRFNAISSAVTSAMSQDGWGMDRKVIQDFTDQLLLMPEVFRDPRKALLELAKTLTKAARYAATNTRNKPELRPASPTELLRQQRA